MNVTASSAAQAQATKAGGVADGAKTGAIVGGVGGAVVGAGIGSLISLIPDIGPAPVVIGTFAVGVGLLGAAGGGTVGALTGGVLGDVGAPKVGFATGAVLGGTLGALYTGGDARSKLMGAVIGAGITGAAGWVAGRALD